MQLSRVSVVAGLAALTGSLITPPAGAQYTPPARLQLQATPILRSLPVPFAQGVAVADLRRKGRIDLIVASSSAFGPDRTNFLSVQLSDGKGGYVAPVSYPLSGTYSSAVVVADFNGDNIPDVLVGNSGEFGQTIGVQVFTGRGDGTLNAPRNAPAFEQANHVAVGDFNGDKKLDIAVTGNQTLGVYVALGRGDGSFLAPTVYDGDQYSYLNDILTADVDGNHQLDLIVARQDGDVTVFPGLGKNRFGSPRRYFIAPNASINRIAIGDFDGDKRPDLVASSDYDGTFLLKASGRGTFRGPVKITTNTLNGVGDLNRDGKLDLVTFNGLQEILLGGGDGKFRLSQRFYGQAYGPLIADANGDGAPDLISAGVGVRVTYGKGDGTFRASGAVFSGQGASSSPYAVTIGDFNGDGKPDFAVANAQEYTVSIFLNQGGEKFAKGRDLPTGSLPIALTTADFNGDGKLDLAVANEFGDSVAFYPGKGNGSFGEAFAVGVGAFPLDVKAGDFNRDGKPDFAVATGGDNAVSVLINQGGNRFAVSALAVGKFPSAITLNDFNGDGFLDFATANQSGGTVSIVRGRGDGTFQAATTVSVGATLYSLTSGDVDGDSKPDIVVTETDNAAVTVLLNKGLNFVKGQTYSLAPAPDKAYAVSLTDLDGDGALDIVTANDLEISVLIGQGGGLFEMARQYFGGSGPIGLTTGDLNGDKRPDILVASRFQGDVSLLFNATP